MFYRTPVPLSSHGYSAYGPLMALAVAPGRDPDETPDDRVLANIAAVALAIVAVAFIVWLVWVYLL